MAQKCSFLSVHIVLQFFGNIPSLLILSVNCNTRNKDVRCRKTLLKALESCIEFDSVFLAYYAKSLTHTRLVYSIFGLYN